MVVPVLMTSCQVSDQPNTGPVIAQTTTTAQASTKAVGDPTCRSIQRANRSNAPALCSDIAKSPTRREEPAFRAPELETLLSTDLIRRNERSEARLALVRVQRRCERLVLHSFG